MRSTFKVLFYLKRTKNTPRAVYPVMGRSTINGTISQFSAKINVPEQLWEVKGGRAKGKSVESERINRHPDNIRILIGKHYRSICDHDAYVTAEKVKNVWLGMGERYRTLVDVFEHDTNDLFKRIGVDRSESTWWCYRAVLGHLRAFLKHEYNLHHIPLLELKQSFIVQYHVYLKTVCHLKAGSVCRDMDRWNNVVRISFNNGLMPRNSFALYRYSAPREPRTFLSEKELRIFQTSRLKSAKHEYHRDLFLFSCFTEICYKDMRYLTCEQIIPDTMGHLRMHGNRCKTGGEYTVNFLPAALRLLEKYRRTAPSPLAFDMPKLSSINCSLRRITKQCGISRHITFHAARHTFATTLCLSQGIPLSTVSKMLGHKQITTTQIYAQTTPIMIEDAIDRVESRLGGKFAT
ncbi:MAG: site-specific integrase [Alistipes sp.]|uniref:site-specific integrase n=1 Tax=Alistipes sp. TaxID=1872444 RepID=UPI0023F1C9FF|nr:site-specific integrase [Alistipes sp.]MBE5686269.1 site-specific integrase [Alistipes sp.]